MNHSSKQSKESLSDSLCYGFLGVVGLTTDVHYIATTSDLKASKATVQFTEFLGHHSLLVYWFDKQNISWIALNLQGLFFTVYVWFYTSYLAVQSDCAIVLM